MKELKSGINVRSIVLAVRNVSQRRFVKLWKKIHPCVLILIIRCATTPFAFPDQQRSSAKISRQAVSMVCESHHVALQRMPGPQSERPLPYDGLDPVAWREQMAISLRGEKFPFVLAAVIVVAVMKVRTKIA